jgi:hypothetical protein
MALQRRSGQGWDSKSSARLGSRRATTARRREADMKLRLGFSVALVAVLYGIWLWSSKPSCLAGYKASLASSTSWTCVSN